MTARMRIGACLSLSGRFAQFGQQAARGLDAWRSLDGTSDVLVEDDRSDRRELEELLPDVAAHCDLLLGPYSTQLMRTAGKMAAQFGWLAWNHGGSGADVEGAHPGHVVSVLTPTSRYAEPFLRHVVSEDGSRELVIVHGAGSFGRQVAEGAETIGRQLGIRTSRADPENPLPPPVGVREFGRVVNNPEGVFGIAQWFPGSRHEVVLGPAEDEFLRAYPGTTPDYPAVQAAAGAMIAVHCAKLAGGTAREGLWAAAAALDTSTLFGGFRIDPRSGTQVKHQTVLVRWAGRQPSPWPNQQSSAITLL